MKTLISNGFIIDGIGGDAYTGDLLMMDGVIEYVGHVPEEACKNAVHIPADGCCITPGFIDIHRHADYAVFKENFGEIELSQGITTMVTGACGLTPYPAAGEMYEMLMPILGEKPFTIQSFTVYRDALNNQPLPINVGAMLGTGSLRAAVKGNSPGPFTDSEMETANKIIDESMINGALGLSMGLMYPPDCYSAIDELARMARAAAKHGGILSAHIRGEGDTLISSIKEAALIAEKAGIALEISHFKCCGVKNWGQGITQAVELIENLRKNQDITVDFYPYTGGATTLLSLIPVDFPREAWGDAAALKKAINTNKPGWDNYINSLGFERIILNSTVETDYNGCTITEVCREIGKNPYEFISNALVNEGGSAGIIIMSMSQEDVDLVAQLPYASVISDALYGGVPRHAHPRLFSAFPKIIRDYVRERKLLTLPEAVRKMTAMPAERMNIKKRGLLKPGYAADVNVFSFERFIDCSDFTRSGLLAEGMEYVWVSGRISWKNKKIQNRYGRFI